MYEFAVTPATTQIRRRGVEITDVTPESLAAELELEAGDRIIRVNGRTVRDYLDFRYQTSGETELILDVKKKSGEDWEVDLEREEGEDFGLTFEQIVPRQCANDCIFCFCKGNPADARPALRIRDEDIRLSFLYGNYTTLTSVTEDEMRRVIEQKLSPQYVSIHATDLDVRAYLLGVDKKRADISSKLERLMDAGIEIHAQVVLCPNINDGAILQSTIRDLAALHPKVISCAIVPLGLTAHNDDPRLTRVTPEWCAAVIKQITPIQHQLRRTLGTTFAFLGDEIYLRANRPVPSRAHYGDYPQIEDGIGMVRSFHESYRKLYRTLARPSLKNKKTVNATIATGRLFAPVLSEVINQLNAYTESRINVVAIESRYFGADITVAGLIAGSDLLAARDLFTGEKLIIPSAMLKSDDEVTLDGVRIQDLERQLGITVQALDLQSLFQLFI